MVVTVGALTDFLDGQHLNLATSSARAAIGSTSENQAPRTGVALRRSRALWPGSPQTQQDSSSTPSQLTSQAGQMRAVPLTSCTHHRRNDVVESAAFASADSAEARRTI
jgi:hypothetical protein